MAHISKQLIIIFIAWIVFFSPIIFGDKHLVPADLLQKELPWATPDSIALNVQNHYIQDALGVFYPWKVFYQRERGELLSWCSKVGLGYPLFARGNFSYFSLDYLSILLFDLPFSTDAPKMFSILLAMIGMVLLTAEFKLSFWAGLISAIAYGFNFQFANYLEVESLVGGLAFLPFILLALEKSIAKESRSYVLLGGLFAGIATLSSSIQTMLLLLLFGGGYLVARRYSNWINYKHEVTRTLPKLGIFITVCLLVSAVMLLPFFESMPLNSRERFKIKASLLATPKRVLALPFFITSVFPDIIGTTQSLDLGKAILGNAGVRRELSSGEALKVYIGVLPFLFAIATFWKFRKRTIRALWCTNGLVILCSISPLFVFLYYRSYTLLCFGMSLLAGFGYDIILEQRDRINNYLFTWSKRVLMASLSIYISVNIVLWLFNKKIVEYGQHLVSSNIDKTGIYSFDISWQLQKIKNLLNSFRLWNPHTIITLCLLALAVGFLYILRSNKNKSFHFASILVLCIVFLDLFWHDWQYFSAVKREKIFPWTEEWAFLEKDKTLFRIDVGSVRGQPPVLPGNYGLIYDKDLVYVSDVFIPELRLRYVNHPFATDILNIKYIMTPLSYTTSDSSLKEVFRGTVKIYQNMDVLQRAFLSSNVIIEKDSKIFYKDFSAGKIDPHEKVVLNEKPLIPLEIREYLGEIKLVAYKNESVEIDVNAINNCILILTDRVYPGWVAELDNTPSRILTAYESFRAIEVPKGSHKIIFTFRSYSYYLGNLVTIGSFSISLLILVIIYSLSIIRLNKTKKIKLT